MKYRQLSRRLRWPNGPGLGDTVSERPWRESTHEFLDDGRGVLVEIPEDAPVDVPSLLRIGALAELTPEELAELEADDGETAG